MKQRIRKTVNQIPELMQDWDFEKNEELNIKPSELTTSSKEKVWWKCRKCNWEWKTSIDNRYYGNTGCPECRLKQRATNRMNTIVKKAGSLKDNKPELIKEWAFEENNKLGIFPDKVTLHSEKKAFWKCMKCGTIYETMICNKVKGVGCPSCTMKLSTQKNIETRIRKYGSLATNHPELLKEWNYAENDKKQIYPDKITSHSYKKVFWTCPICGNVYQATVSHRVEGTACPKCYSEIRTSFPEQAIYYYLKQYYKKTENRYMYNETEIDIFIPELNMGIEYDGSYFHKGKSNIAREQKKYHRLRDNGIKLIRIKESNNKEHMKDNADYFVILEKRNNYKCLKNVIIEIFNMMNIKTNDNSIDIDRDRLEIYNQYLTAIKENSIEKLYPALAKEWCYEKNGSLKPSMISKGTSKKVWWKCSKGHTWEATVNSRTQGSGCPQCAGQKVISGEIDLATKFPDIAKEWDYSKNDTSPDKVMPGSNKKVWWICGNNHSYYASPNARTGNKHAHCPMCSGKQVKKGYNDFASQFPVLLKQWDYEENNKLNIFPDTITIKSNKRIHWVCEKGHKWVTSVYSRTRKSNGTECPICINKQILEGYNDFASKFPNLLSEWDYDKNNELGIYPNKVSTNFNKSVWWKCSKCNHEWKTKIYHRTSKKNNCPMCSARLAANKTIKTRIIKNGSFADNHSELLKEWDYEKNNKNGIYPNSITSGSHQRIWWICKNGHSYSTILKSRTRKNGSCCPKCHK